MPTDSFGFVAGSGLVRNVNEIRKGGLAIATFVDDGAGTLTISFTDANGAIPTSADADNILRQISYGNANPVPPASVTLTVTFDDGDAGFPLQATANVTVFINTAPVITGLGPANAFSGTPVLIDNDGNADIADVQLDALNNYNGSTLTVARQGGADANDSFTFMDTGTLTFNANTIEKNGQSIASFVDDGAGTLTIVFTDANGEAPTSADVDAILQNILYSTTTPGPTMVTLDVTFDDGGVAGGQKPRQDTESVTVTIV